MSVGRAGRRTISKAEVVALIVVSLLVHVAIIWFLLKGPKDTQAEIMPQAAPPPPPPSVEVDLTPPPPEPEAETPPVDENSVKPPPKKVEPKPTPKPEPKPKPKPKPKPEPKPKPKPAPKPTPAPKPAPKPSPEPSKSSSSSSSSTTTKSNANANANSNKVTPATSGMQSLGNPPPQYPPLALRRRIEGTVGLKILVTPQGRAGQVQVTKSSGSSLLDDAAVNTVKGWKFKPARRGDTPISGWALQSIAFHVPQ